jgi:cytochrome P450
MSLCILTELFITDSSIAASDTTAVTLTFLLYYLLANPPHWDRLTKEIRSRFRSPDEMTNSALMAIPFLEATINESNMLFSV